MEKVIMQGMIEGKRNKGLSRSQLIDQTRSATGLPLCDHYALAEACHLRHCIYEVTSKPPTNQFKLTQLFPFNA